MQFQIDRLMNIEVYKDDIKKIGYTAYENDGMLSIICCLETANIEGIILRTILRMYGDYKILGAIDYWPDDHLGPDIEFLTNMPWEIYSKQK